MENQVIFTINCGSSSLKFSVYPDQANQSIAQGMVERIGQDPKLHLTLATEGTSIEQLDPKRVPDHPAALRAIFTAVGQRIPNSSITAIGHRVVHGGPHLTCATRIDDEVLKQLCDLVPFAPLHQPFNVAGVRAAIEAFPNALQVACFDTAFHQGHPFVNDTFALPRRYHDQGVRRYGFHGLSYQFIASQLKSDAPELHEGRVIVAHLGSGASMCAMRKGTSIDTTMAFGVLDGLPMGTRCGQLDPSVVLFMMQHEKLSAEEITTILYHQSGLLGMSGVSNDVRELDASDDPRCQQSLEYMAYRIRREIGAMAATLGGLDALVFTGGIGEHHPWTRANACRNMEWLGIRIDESANQTNATRINAPDAIPVLVMPTNEERVIAQSTAALANQRTKP